jgi:hypothetical protein
MFVHLFYITCLGRVPLVTNRADWGQKASVAIDFMKATETLRTDIASILLRMYLKSLNFCEKVFKNN